MRKIKKLTALMLAVVMALAMSITVFAQTEALSPADPDNATITINNAAKGETYSIYKLFDATVNGDNIAYQCPGEIPSELAAFFSKDSKDNVIPVDSILVKDEAGKVTGTNMTSELKAALETWAKSNADAMVNQAVSKGDKLEFTGLPYGYYVMVTTNVTGDKSDPNAKAAITVTSTQPDASIYDKNTNEPSASKEADKDSYSIGDTITYTAEFDTTNYMGEGENAKQVIEYKIEDTLPEFLSNVQVTSITIGEEDYKLTDGKVPQFDDKKIIIPWATENSDGTYTSIYAQGAKIVVTYTATLTSTTNINADNKNTISIRPYVDDNGKKPWKDTWKKEEVIKTYAAAIKKVDDDHKPLAGAVFTIAGLTTEKVEDGVYRVTSYKPGDATVVPTEMATDNEGKLYIVGLAEDVTLVVTEFKAPDGYNKLEGTMDLKAQKLSEIIYETSGERRYDEDGNLVKESTEFKETKEVEKNLSELDTAALEIVNNKGTLLPSTGGIGTTIFYIVGAILVIGAGVILVVKKRMSNE